MVTVLFFIILSLIQFVLWRHANQAVALAAEEALDAAQVENGGVGAGQAAAESVLAQTGQVTNQNVSVSIAGEVVAVTITAEPKFSVIPINDTVSATATGQVERFIGEQDR